MEFQGIMEGSSAAKALTRGGYLEIQRKKRWFDALPSPTA